MKTMIDPPKDMLGAPIAVGDHIVLPQAQGGSTIILQVYEILELIETENWSWTYNSQTTKYEQGKYPSWKAKAQVLVSSSKYKPEKPSFIENFRLSLKIPKGWIDLDE